MMPHPAYQQHQAEMPETVVPTAENSMVAIFRMKSGVLVQLGKVPSGPGHDW